jgi:Fur family transcriptional regulator, ferric uptake regulator
MTAPPYSPPQVFDNVEDAIRSLRSSGLRISTARRLVLEGLFAADGPVSAAHLARRLSLDESSVYRNLELLEDRGLLRHLHLGHSPGLYVLASEHEVEYLYCERCARVTPVPPDRLDPIRKQITRRFGYTPRFTHFAIVGTCQDCGDAPAETGQADEGRTSSPQRQVTSKRKPNATRAVQHQQLHSHGDYVHSHPRAQPGRGKHSH